MHAYLLHDSRRFVARRRRERRRIGSISARDLRQVRRVYRRGQPAHEYLRVGELTGVDGRLVEAENLQNTSMNLA